MTTPARPLPPVGPGPCFIIPRKVLVRLAKDRRLTPRQRADFASAAALEAQWRKVRSERGKLTRLARATLPSGLTLAAAAVLPAVNVFDCRHGTTLPGTPVPDPERASDGTARRAFVETAAVADFYQTLFRRNSLDGAGMTLISSVHYSVHYNNAFWSGTQMTYGDGDGKMFLDFTKSNDVIGHELTHGVTQFSAGFNYTGEAGGLNESMSDVFGTMFRQWRAGHDVTQADWLIGGDLMGPTARAQGFTCLRDMADPAAKHCLAPQPKKYAQVKPGMDPHDSSGIPNLAFYLAAMEIGGRSWEKAGLIWYQALTGFPPSPGLKMAGFAKRTRQLAATLFSGEPAVSQAIDAAWRTVGL
jgi:Zn-dependent metalloprotease